MMKHNLCSFFVAMMAMLCPLSAQTLMHIRLHDGSQVSFPVRDIDMVMWEAADGGDQNIDGETSVTGSATDVTNQTATVTAYANDILDNLSTDLRVGIIYTTEGTPSRSNGQQVTVRTSDLAADGKYSITLTGLAPSTTYAYRSFVYQSGLWFYGHVKTFTTKGQGESFTTGAASKVTCFSAVVSASVNIDPATTYRTLTYGICYGTSFEPTTSNSTVQCNDRNAEGAYTATLRGLLGNTTYYYRPYAIIDGYTTYGQTSSFQTQADNVVETLSVDAETGVVKAHLSLGGGAYSALELGVCYAHTELPTVTDGRVTTNEVDDERNFEVRLPYYLLGTYYVRAYVLIDGAAHYGAAISATFEKSDFANGDFESWEGDTPTGWQTASYAGNARLSKSTDAHGGSFAVCVKGESQNRRLGHQEMILEAGTYTCSFWTKAATSKAACLCPGYAAINDSSIAYNYDKGDDGKNKYVNDISQTWQQVTYSFTLDAKTTVCLIVMNSKTTGSDLLIDDFTINMK